MENDDPLEEIKRLLANLTTVDVQQIDNTTIDTTKWNLNNTMNYIPYPTTFPPLTTTQIQNMGIGTTGSMPASTVSLDISKLNYKDFETTIPSLYKINEMREMFPGFKKAWDHMRTIYDLVNEEYIERKKGK